MRKLVLPVLLLFFLATPWRASAAEDEAILAASLAAASSPAEVIAAIQNYRAANGLPPYEENSILMGTAQGQADYMASTGVVSHTGPGGSTPKDRAAAAGYGNGNTIFLSEIIYAGNNATADTALQWWMNSPDHNPWMLSTTYRDIGAGSASAGTYNYYAAVMASDSGVPAPPGTAAPGGSGNPTVLIIPVVRATPGEDGSIVHTVRTGQTLWSIAAVYEVPLQTLFDLNGLTEFDFIFPGDQVIVKAGEGTPTPTVPIPTLRPTATHLSLDPTAAPTGAGAPQAPAEAGDNASGGEAAQSPGGAEASFENPTVRWVVMGAFGILFVVLIGSLFRPRAQEVQGPADDDVV